MEKPDNLLGTERRLAQPLLAVTLLLAASGYATYFWKTHAVWAQWTTVLHAVAGIGGTLLLLAYVAVHFQRSLGMRRPVLVLSGLVGTAAFLALALTGLQIVAYGRSEAQAWIYTWHVWLAGLTLALTGAHLAAHGWLFLDRRRKPERGRYQTLGLEGLKQGALLNAGALGLVALATVLHSVKPAPFHDQPAITPYTHSYGEHPFRPSQTETATGGFLDARRVGGSERCAACHQDIARQWQASIHSQAAADQAYQTNIKLLAERKGMAATRYCEGCHAPAALLSGQLTEGGKLDTVGHMREGVSCMACHGIDQVIHVKGVASYRFAPPEPYLFEGEAGAVPTLVHNLAIRLQPRQHRADMAKPVLSSPELCATCHAQFMDKDFNNWGWVKMQDDYLAWLNGPYSGQARQTYAQAQARRCQDCHFPKEPGQDPSADPDGRVKTHFNIAANTAIPGHVGNSAQLSRTARFLASDKLRISIDRPNREDATESARHVDPSVSAPSEAPAYAYLGETVALKIAVTNAEVGHAFPGGTTDLNEAWLHVQATDGQGRKLYDSGFLNPDGAVEPGAYFYKSIPIDRLGNPVWRHDLFNMVGDSFKRVIPPGGTDIAVFSFPVPDWAKGAVTAVADLNYRKFNIAYARWALKDEQAKPPIVTMATGTLRLPVRTRPEIAPVATARD